LNWAGTPGELKEYIGRMKSICDGIKGVELKGVYSPTSEWNYLFLLETTSYDKGLEVIRTYLKSMVTRNTQWGRSRYSIHSKNSA